MNERETMNNVLTIVLRLVKFGYLKVISYNFFSCVAVETAEFPNQPKPTG